MFNKIGQVNFCLFWPVLPRHWPMGNSCRPPVVHLEINAAFQPPSLIQNSRHWNYGASLPFPWLKRPRIFRFCANLVVYPRGFLEDTRTKWHLIKTKTTPSNLPRLVVGGGFHPIPSGIGWFNQPLEGGAVEDLDAYALGFIYKQKMVTRQHKQKSQRQRMAGQHFT